MKSRFEFDILASSHPSRGWHLFLFPLAGQLLWQWMCHLHIFKDKNSEDTHQHVRGKLGALRLDHDVNTGVASGHQCLHSAVLDVGSTR